MSQEIITGLDIGSYAVRVATGQILPGNQDRIQIIGAIEVPSSGVRKGVVTDLEETISSISKALEQAERLTGFPIERVWVGISGSHILTQQSKGVIGVARNDGEIREEDVSRALEAARTIAMPTNYEILHVIPKCFVVDGQSGVKDPVGMHGIRLEVETLMIQGRSSHIKNLTKCVYRAGLHIEDLVFSILATAEAVATPKQKDLGVCVVNIGASTTSLVIFEEGDILHTSVLPMGSDHITSDLAIGLRTSIDVAEQIKIQETSVNLDKIQKKDEINLADFGAAEPEYVGRRFIGDIAHARVQEIFEEIDKELRKVERSGLLPAGILLTGAGSKLDGMIEVAKQTLRLPVTQGVAMGVTSLVERIQDPSMSTAIGLLVWGYQIQSMVGKTGHFSKLFSQMKRLDQMKGMFSSWFRSLKP